MASPPQSKKVIFHRQGGLDALCGIYCLINAMELMFGAKFNTEKAFSVLIASFGPQLITATLDGLTPPMIKLAVKTSIKHLREDEGIKMRMRPAFKKTPSTLAEWWAVVSDHIENNGEGSVVMGITGIHHHWTCIRRLTPKMIILADSGHLGLIQRSRATIKKETSRRPHVLIPTETFLLSAH